MAEADDAGRLLDLEKEVARLHGCVGVLSEGLHVTLVALEVLMDPERPKAFMHRALVEGLRPRIEYDYSGEERMAALEMLSWIESHAVRSDDEQGQG